MDCGMRFHPWVMEFDHRGDVEKRFNISKGHKTGWKALKAEMDKCDVVCANCHRLRSFSRSQRQRPRPLERVAFGGVDLMLPL